MLLLCALAICEVGDTIFLDEGGNYSIFLLILRIVINLFDYD